MNNRQVILLAVSALLGSSTIAFSFSGVEPFSSVNADRTSTSVLQSEPEQFVPALADDQHLEVEVITVTENGFDPPLVTRTRGPFIIALHNRSGESELVFRIFRAQGERLHEIGLRAGRRANHLRLDLPIGDYIISETNHPSWSCALTITR